MAVAMLTTMNVAIARQTASDSVNFHIARMQRTVQATSDIVMTMKEMIRTIFGWTTPRSSDLDLMVISVESSFINEAGLQDVTHQYFRHGI